MKTSLRAEVELTAPFCDVDLTGVVWHGNYFRYLELARLELMEKVHFGYREMMASGYVWPIVDTQVRYIQPIRCGQRFRVRCDLAEYENRLRIEYLLTDIETGRRLARARTDQVAVHQQTGEMSLVTPKVLLDRLAAL